MYHYDPTLFDAIVLPDGANKETLVGVIMDYAGDNECRYIDPKKLKTMTELFFKMYQYKYERLWLSTMQEYEMIENYDRKEEIAEHIDDSTTRTEKEIKTGNSNTDTNVDTSSNSTKTGQGTNVGLVSAFNETDFSNKDKQTSDTTDTVQDSSNVTSGTTGTSNDTTDKNGNDIGKRDRTLSSRVHGNIGVTTSQQMLQSERELANFSWYYQVAMDYEDAITIPVY